MRRLFEQSALGPVMKVLDVGSGAGDLAFLAVEQVALTGLVVRVDQNPTVLDQARDASAAVGLTNVRLVEAREATRGRGVR